MTEFGAFLKQAREDRGVTLRQIATSTKISMVALEALERGDFARLPGGIFSRAFVRAYAVEVGLEPDRTVATFVEEYDKALSMRDERIIRPEVTADNRDFLERQHRAARILRWSLIVLALAAVGALIMWQVRTRPPAGAASEVSAPVIEPAPAPVQTPPAAELNPSPQTLQASAPGAIQAGGAALPPIAAPAATPPVSAAPDAVAVHVEVTEDCWVRARVDGALVFAAVLHAGDQRDVKPGREVMLDVGNAGAVRWTVNGQRARSLGRPGQTASVVLTKATLAQYVQ